LGISQNGDQCMDSFSQQGPFPEWGPKGARVCVLYVKFGGRAGWGRQFAKDKVQSAAAASCILFI